MARPRFELADIFRQHGQKYRQSHRLSSQQLRVMRAIEQCRTARLGGHRDQCDRCGYTRVSYNSCRNRHCPKCQSMAKAEWLDQQQSHLLPVHYFHVVFTIPDQLAHLALQNKKVVYNILFRATSETLRRIAADPKHLGAQIGFLAVLHTWGQTLSLHPHLHCVVPGGGLSLDGRRWIACRKRFFLSVRVLSRLFRGLFLHYLKEAFEQQQLEFHGSLAPLSDKQAFTNFLDPLHRLDWVVYAKRPFGGPKQVLDYLGRYTHRVAISNHRLLTLDSTHVAFNWRDYRHSNQVRTMTLEPDEFIRRFLLHVLPPGFVRIRHYGLLSNSLREQKLATCRLLLGACSPLNLPKSETPDSKDRYGCSTQEAIDLCPQCHQGRLLPVEVFLSAFLSRLGLELKPRLDSS
jgi:predicted Zn-ribbon and HTH transcriptional regulator